MSRAAALRRDDAAGQGAAANDDAHSAPRPPAPPGKTSTHSRPKLYLASHRRPDGSVVTFKPDGEVLTNTYDSGGNLKSAEGQKGTPSAGGVYRYG